MPKGKQGKKGEKKLTPKERIAALADEAEVLQKMLADLPGHKEREEQKRQEAMRIAQLREIEHRSNPFSGVKFPFARFFGKPKGGGTRRRTRRKQKSKRGRKTRRVRRRR